MIKRMFASKRMISGVLSLVLLATVLGSASLNTVADRTTKQSAGSAERIEVAQSQAISDLQSYAGGNNPAGCQVGWVGLGIGLLAAGVLIAATGGAGAVALVVAGSFVPLGAATC